MNKYVNFLRKKVAQFSSVKPAVVDLDEAIVSFTFDDVPECGFSNGLDILNRYGMRGTFYLSMCFLDHPTAEASFRSEHIHAAVDGGHELAGHTLNHIEAYDVSREEMLQNVMDNQKRIQEIVPSYAFKNFSYPYGHQTQAAREVVFHHFDTGRGNEHGINRGKIDLNNLKSMRLYEKNYTPEEIFGFLEQARKIRGWLIFYTHDIQASYSPYGCSPSYFEKAVKYCHDQGLRVLPVCEALDQIRFKE